MPMTLSTPTPIAGARHAFQVIHPGSPMLRVRYVEGVAVDPYGFPDWTPFARTLVELPAVAPPLGADEVRVLDVLTANETAAAGVDPLWRGLEAGATPVGWTWAHLGRTRQVALVPVELHGAFRHLGGVSTDGGDPARRGLAVEGGPPAITVAARLADEALAKVERHLGYALPSAYRSLLLRTNGGAPARPAVHPRFGFVVDQPMFGLARPDRLQDLVYANAWFGDHLTPEWLAVGYVQGGLIAVRVHGPGRGSVAYLDDDDPRDRDAYGAAEVCERLLHHCAEDFTSFWRALREVPTSLLARARTAAEQGQARILTPPRLGAGLPAAKRAQPG
jgi:A nuclease of the HNH/ENDO VII superfamily with conserved WHH